VADPGDYHRGLTNALEVAKAPNHQAVDLMTIMVAKAPNHQAVDLMTIMPHVNATGILVHTPVTHGHIITIVATPKKKMTKEEILTQFNQHARIRVV